MPKQKLTETEKQELDALDTPQWKQKVTYLITEILAEKRRKKDAAAASNDYIADLQAKLDYLTDKRDEEGNPQVEDPQAQVQTQA